MGLGFTGLTFTSEEWCMAYPDSFRLHSYYLWRIQAAVYSRIIPCCEFWGIYSNQASYDENLMSEIQAMLCNPKFAFSGTGVAGGSTCIRLLQAAAKPLVCSALAFKYITSLCPRPKFPSSYLPCWGHRDQEDGRPIRPTCIAQRGVGLV